MTNRRPLELEVIDYAILKAKESGIAFEINEEQTVVNFGQILIREISILNATQLKEVLNYHKTAQGLGV